MKKIEQLRLLQVIMIILLAIFIVLTVFNVRMLQGTARVVNYAGIARGATQRLIKLEIAKQPNPGLEQRLDIILEELKHGGEVNGLICLSAPYYQSCLDIQTAYWQELKQEIELVRSRGSYGNTNIISVSERYFVLADTTVAAAERYSDRIARAVAMCEYVMAFLIVGLVLLSFILYRLSSKEVQERELVMRHQAEHDAMTGLLNRGSFDALLKIHEAGGNPFALVLIDVDHFKEYNDSYGHLVGDEVLKRVAASLNKTCRRDDHICRIGGDEFAIIMDGMHHDLKSVVDEKLEGLLQGLGESCGNGVPITLSIGVAFLDTIPPGETIFSAADHALYQVKAAGRNGYGYYEP